MGLGAWYTIGLYAGLGAALGVAATGALRRWPLGAGLAVVVLVAVGLVVSHWGQAAGGGVGAVCGAIGASPLVAGTLRRGGTRGGTAALFALAALLGAGLAFIPVVGYLEALAVPLFGLRLRRRAPETHAGLRTLARD
jgi:hypothetical protein